MSLLNHTDNAAAFAAAMNATAPAQTLYGEILLDVWFCALVRGQGKVPFDPNQHMSFQRRTAVNISLTPLAETGLSYTIDRALIAEMPNDGWMRVTLPSLKALGMTDLAALSGKYVRAEMTDYGTYTKRDGTPGKLSAPHIHAVYDTREQCLAAYEAEMTGGAPAPAMPSVNGNGHAPAAPVAPVANSDAERQAALAFLPAIVRMCMTEKGVDLNRLKAQIEGNELMRKHVSMTSPELMAEVAKLASESMPLPF